MKSNTFAYMHLRRDIIEQTKECGRVMACLYRPINQTTEVAAACLHQVKQRIQPPHRSSIRPHITMDN
jgi:hypothetical protein